MFGIHKVKKTLSIRKKNHIKETKFHINKVNKTCIITKIDGPTICSFEGIH